MSTQNVHNHSLFISPYTHAYVNTCMCTAGFHSSHSNAVKLIDCIQMRPIMAAKWVSLIVYFNKWASCSCKELCWLLLCTNVSFKSACARLFAWTNYSYIWDMYACITFVFCAAKCFFFVRIACLNKLVQHIEENLSSAYYHGVLLHVTVLIHCRENYMC